MIRVTAVLIKDKEDRFLFLKRNPDKKIYPLKWHVLAGTIEEGETPEACAKREIAEEIGDDVKLKFMKKGETYVDKQPDYEFLVYLFVYEYMDGKVILNDENIEYEWVKLDEITKLFQINYKLVLSPT